MYLQIVALIMLPAMARMAFTVEDDHRLLKEVATRGNRGNKIAPFMFRKIRDPSEEIGDRQTDKEQLQEHQQQQQSQSPGGIENMWSRNINRDRILNTVLAQMQQKDSRTPVSEIWNDNADYGDSDGIYTNDQVGW